jgi:hypothetical protein
MLLVQRDLAVDAHHELVTLRVHLPAVPRTVELVERHEPPLHTIVGVRRAVALVPLRRPVELLELHRGRTQTQMHRESTELERPVSHRSTS